MRYMSHLIAGYNNYKSKIDFIPSSYLKSRKLIEEDFKQHSPFEGRKRAKDSEEPYPIINLIEPTLSSVQSEIKKFIKHQDSDKLQRVNESEAETKAEPDEKQPINSNVEAPEVSSQDRLKKN